MNRERRHFLKMAGHGLGGTALAGLMERMALTTALAQPPAGDYKALVCVFLGGGNDGNNMVIPLTTTNPKLNYQAYYNVRHANNLALAQNTLNNTVISGSNIPDSTFALHPEFASANGDRLYPLWGQGKLAILTNVGPLTRPLTKAQYVDPTVKKPYHLFSHSDQQQVWQTAQALRVISNGWAGRIADSIPPAQPPIPVNTSVNGYPVFIAGGNSTPLVVAAAPTSLNKLLVINQPTRNADDTVRINTLMELTGLDLDHYLINSTSGTTSQAFGIAQYFNVADPAFSTVFPNTALGNQLKQVARIIKVVTDGAIVNRQIFFCSLGGFDTHSNELTGHTNLFAQMNNAMRAFYDATVEMGLADQVTTFTMSDFGRTYQPTGSGNSVGSDHAWGNHHLILGGAVRGGNFYGTRRADLADDPVSIFPVPDGPTSVGLGGASDTDTGNGARGRWIPTTAVEQYGATLATWFGLDAGFLNYVFPNLALFPTSDLGFMNAG